MRAPARRPPLKWWVFFTYLGAATIGRQLWRTLFGDWMIIDILYAFQVIRLLLVLLQQYVEIPRPGN